MFTSEMGRKIMESVENEQRAADEHKARAVNIDKAWKEQDYVTLAEMEVLSWRDAVEIRLAQVNSEHGLTLVLANVSEKEAKAGKAARPGRSPVHGKYVGLSDVLLRPVVLALDGQVFDLEGNAWYTKYRVITSPEFDQWIAALTTKDS